MYFQLMVVGVIMELGLIVQIPVEEAFKPEQEPALTLLLPIVEQTVLEKRLKLKIVKKKTVQVCTINIRK